MGKISLGRQKSVLRQKGSIFQENTKKAVGGDENTVFPRRMRGWTEADKAFALLNNNTIADKKVETLSPKPPFRRQSGSMFCTRMPLEWPKMKFY